MSGFGVNELTQLKAYGFTVGCKVTLQNAVVIRSQKFNSSPRMSSEISSVGDFESVDLPVLFCFFPRDIGHTKNTRGKGRAFCRFEACQNTAQ